MEGHGLLLTRLSQPVRQGGTDDARGWESELARSWNSWLADSRDDTGVPNGAQSELHPVAKLLPPCDISPKRREPAMTSEPPLSHEIRYVLSVYGGILIARMAMLLRNVALMAKLRLVSARLCDRASAARSRRRFPAMVTEPEREFPAYSPERTTRPRPFLQNVDQDCDRRSTANLRLGLERRLVPGI